MKNLKVVSAMFVAVLLFSSCVSNRKYNEAMTSKANTEKLYNSVLTENNRLKDENNQLQTTAANEKAALNERE